MQHADASLTASLLGQHSLATLDLGQEYSHGSSTVAGGMKYARPEKLGSKDAAKLDAAKHAGDKKSGRLFSPSKILAETLFVAITL